MVSLYDDVVICTATLGQAERPGITARVLAIGVECKSRAGLVVAMTTLKVDVESCGGGPSRHIV